MEKKLSIVILLLLLTPTIAFNIFGLSFAKQFENGGKKG